MAMKDFFSALKALLGLFIYGITFAALCIAGAAIWFAYMLDKPGPLGAQTSFTINRGQGVGVIAARLEEEGLIDSPLAFRAGTIILKAQGDLKAGEYAIEPRTSIRDLITLFESGKVILRQFTIPEGLTSYEVVRELNTVDDLKGEITDIPPEGTLLPETYSYHKGDTKQDALDHMRASMTKVIDELWPKRAEDLPYDTKAEAVTMASIIEKETAIPNEHAKVAGVFINRLKRGMPLQTDPTVIYAITEGQHKNEGMGPLGRRLLKKDLEIDSPYNTYKNAGLPPGPIANPGIASIKAALNPENHDYIYFVADGTGGHAFAKTLAEHNRNVAKWRRIRKTK